MRPLSYSAISTWEDCPRKLFYRHIERVKIDAPPSPAMLRGLEMHKLAENFLLGQHEGDLPPPLDFYQDYFTGLRQYTLEPEWKFGLTPDFELGDFDDPQILIRGVVDLKMVSDTLDVFEFKTGKIYDEHVNQMNLYSIPAMLAHPEFETVKVTAVYFDQQDSIEETFLRSSMFIHIDHWKAKVAKIKSDEVFMPKPAYRCRWCEFSRHNGGPCQF
jgi:hypothetical protein